MNMKAGSIGLAAVLCASFVFATPPDGINLSANRGAGGVVLLSWDTGSYVFSVYRSTVASSVLDPGNKLGETTNHNWNDTAPAGGIFYYTITRACAVGYADCDGLTANGCEVDTHVAQSTSPASIWASNPNPSQDLKPGYARVTGITNCGGCGITCDDGIPCTTDLCVPVGPAGSVVGVCRHYDRGQCATARCGTGQLPSGTPPPEDAACTAVDSDGDGLPDPWESAHQDPYTSSPDPVGVDINCDGEISAGNGDMIYTDPPNPTTPDIYVQYDIMQSDPSETQGHAPPQAAIDAVVAAFQLRGITLHIEPVHQSIPHSTILSFAPPGPDPCNLGDSQSFYQQKNAHFDPRLRFTHHYMIFGHDSCYGGASTSGIAEIKGNDVAVTLGSFAYAGPGTVLQELIKRETAGTMMHELGHNLGLDHGGVDDSCTPAPCPGDTKARKPNFLSSMNYRYQFTGIARSATAGAPVPLDPTTPWRVDYSSDALGTLIESGLDEIGGIAGAPSPRDRDIVYYDCAGSGPHLGPAHGPIDWNCDSVYSPSATADVNSDSSLTTLVGANDWSLLKYAFQCSPAFADGSPAAAYLSTAELSAAAADAAHLRAFLICQTNAECDDGNFCNGAEICSPTSHTCQAGTPPNCDDGNACTTDSCSPSSNACAHTPVADGTTCSDVFCTVGKSCQSGVCAGGTPRNCEDGLACTTNTCSEALQACTSTCNSQPCWSAAAGGGNAAAPGSDSSIRPPGSTSYSYVAKGNSLYAIRNTSEGALGPGTVKWTWNEPGGNSINNFPSPVPLSNGSGEYIYLGGLDGFLYKIYAEDASYLRADVRRPVCSGDGMLATPSVQLYQFSNSAFQSNMNLNAGHMNDDLVIGITKDGCNDASQNRIYGLYASDLSIKWVFNQPATSMVDFGSDGCALDYTNNRVYCGTNLATGRNQNSLWAIDTLSGNLVWSTNAGSVLNRPILGNGKLYVANPSGSVMAYDPASGASLWTGPISVSAGITRNPWVEFRPGGFARAIFVVDNNGKLYRFTDQGSMASLDWTVTPPAGSSFSTAPVVEPNLGKVYLGRNDGMVQQLNASTGTIESSYPLSQSPFDPSLDSVPWLASSFNRLTVASGSGAAGTVAQYCVALTTSPSACTTNADCVSLNSVCSTGTCNTATGVCYSAPAPDLTSCDDGKACSAGDKCRSGVCKADDYSACPCTQTGDAACATGQTCCNGTCVNLNSNVANCGACGFVCGPGRTCSLGDCNLAAASCSATSTSILTSVKNQLTGLDAMDFDRGAATCYAYAVNARNPSTSSIQRIDPAGGITSINSPSADTASFNGVAVAREGNHFFAGMVNKPSGSFPQATPGLVDGTITPASAAIDRTTIATFSNVPFAVAMYDQGPVGPALDTALLTSSGIGKVYFGNWTNNGDVFVVQQTTPSSSWTANAMPVTILPTGDRITAIAYSPATTTAPIHHRQLFVAHGSTLSVFDVDTSTQNDVLLANAAPPAAIVSVLSVAAHPTYGDAYLEVKSSTGSTLLLMVRSDDLSVRRVPDVAIDLKLPVVPGTFTDEGRLVFSPTGALVRYNPATAPPNTPSFNQYSVAK